MNIENIVDYVLNTPGNTNPNILRQKLNALAPSPSPSGEGIIYIWAEEDDITFEEATELGGWSCTLYDNNDNPFSYGDFYSTFIENLDNNVQTIIALGDETTTTLWFFQKISDQHIYFTNGLSLLEIVNIDSIAKGILTFNYQDQYEIELTSAQTKNNIPLITFNLDDDAITAAHNINLSELAQSYVEDYLYFCNSEYALPVVIQLEDNNNNVLKQVQGSFIFLYDHDQPALAAFNFNGETAYFSIEFVVQLKKNPDYDLPPWEWYDFTNGVTMDNRQYEEYSSTSSNEESLDVVVINRGDISVFEDFLKSCADEYLSQIWVRRQEIHQGTASTEGFFSDLLYHLISADYRGVPLRYVFHDADNIYITFIKDGENDTFRLGDLRMHTISGSNPNGPCSGQIIPMLDTTIFAGYSIVLNATSDSLEFDWDSEANADEIIIWQKRTEMAKPQSFDLYKIQEYGLDNGVYLYGFDIIPSVYPNDFNEFIINNSQDNGYPEDSLVYDFGCSLLNKISYLEGTFNYKFSFNNCTMASVEGGGGITQSMANVNWSANIMALATVTNTSTQVTRRVTLPVILDDEADFDNLLYPTADTWERDYSSLSCTGAITMSVVNHLE